MTKLTALKLSFPPESDKLRQRKRSYQEMKRGCKLVLMLVFVSCQTFSAIPKSASEVEVKEMIRDREKKQELSPEELKEKAEEQRKARNAEIKEELSKPPTDFEHYTSPPSRNMDNSVTLGESSSSTQTAQSTVAQSSWTNMKILLVFAILVSITFFAVTMIALRKRSQNNTERQ